VDRFRFMTGRTCWLRKARSRRAAYALEYLVEPEHIREGVAELARISSP